MRERFDGGRQVRTDGCDVNDDPEIGRAVVNDGSEVLLVVDESPLSKGVEKALTDLQIPHDTHSRKGIVEGLPAVVHKQDGQMHRYPGDQQIAVFFSRYLSRR